MSNRIGTAIGLKQVERKVLLTCGGWALLSLLVFGGGMALRDRPDWFVLLVSLLKIGSFLLATALCWRNTMHPSILSGRNVWQAIALGMAFYALGDITVILWRSLWGMTSTVSLGDVFYGASYLFLALGLLLAVMPRPINLSLPQTLGISFTGIVGIVLASWINFYAPTTAPELPINSAEIVQAEILQTNGAMAEPLQRRIATSTDAVLAVQPADSKGAAAGAIASSSKSAPAIIRTIDERLSGIASHLGLLYVAGDCALVVMAVALLVAFWGDRKSVV